MKCCGWQNVRGGKWCRIKLNVNPMPLYFFNPMEGVAKMIITIPFEKLGLTIEKIQPSYVPEKIDVCERCGRDVGFRTKLKHVKDVMRKLGKTEERYISQMNVLFNDVFKLSQ